MRDFEEIKEMLRSLNIIEEDIQIIFKKFDEVVEWQTKEEEGG